MNASEGTQVRFACQTLSQLISLNVEFLDLYIELVNKQSCICQVGTRDKLYGGKGNRLTCQRPRHKGVTHVHVHMKKKFFHQLVRVLA